MSKKAYRAAVIGCGSRSHDHIRAYEQIDNASVVACCAPTPARREAMAAKYKIAAYADAAEMIRKEAPDIVHVVTWPTVRVEPLTIVSELGVPLCTVEKPVAAGVADWRALCRLQAKTRTKFAVCHQTRWNEHLEACRQAIASGEMGKPLMLHLSAGMNIAGQGTHTLNYGLSLLGDPKVAQVFGAASGWDHHDTGHPGPTTTMAALTLETGLQALWTTGPASVKCGDPNTTYQHVRAGACLEGGRVEWQQFGGWEIVTGDRKREGRCFIDGAQFGANWLREQADFHKAMFAWLETPATPAGTNLERSLHEWAVVLALYQSALERRPVDMASFDPADDLVERFKAAVG